MTRNQSSKKSKRAITVVDTISVESPPAPIPSVEESQSPNISRVIPEVFVSRIGSGVVLFFASFFTGFLMMAIVLEGYQIHGVLQALQRVQARQTDIERQITYWQGITSNHPDYRDAYFKLAVLEQQVGKTTEAQLYLTKTLTIDPNYTPARTLADKLSMQ